MQFLRLKFDSKTLQRLCFGCSAEGTHNVGTFCWGAPDDNTAYLDCPVNPADDLEDDLACETAHVQLGAHPLADVFGFDASTTPDQLLSEAVQSSARFTQGRSATRLYFFRIVRMRANSKHRVKGVDDQEIPAEVVAISLHAAVARDMESKTVAVSAQPLYPVAAGDGEQGLVVS